MKSIIFVCRVCVALYIALFTSIMLPAIRPATAQVSSTDTDSDGIANIDDIDDDNDGILDVTEMASVSSAANGGFPSGSITTVTANKKYTQTAGAVTITYTNISSTGTIAPYTESTVNSNELYATGTSISYVYPFQGAKQEMTFSQSGVAKSVYSKFYITDIDQTGESHIIKIYDQNGTLIANPASYVRTTAEGTSGTSAPGTPTLFTGIGSNVLVTSGVNSVTVTPNPAANSNTFLRSRIVFFDFSGIQISKIEVENAGTAGQPGFLFDIIAVPRDTDGDGIPDHLDIDSDNDGITDNVEAQTTAGYIAPSGVGAAMTDIDDDGLDDRYDANTGSKFTSTSKGLTPVDTDSDGTKDFLDFNSDGDSLNDIAERGDGRPTSITSTTDTDGDGLLDIFEGSSINDFFDVNDENLDASGNFNLADTDNDTAANGVGAVPLNADLDYRDVPVVTGPGPSCPVSNTAEIVTNGTFSQLGSTSTEVWKNWTNNPGNWWTGSPGIAGIVDDVKILTLSQNGLTGWSRGRGNNGTAQIAITMSWGDGQPAPSLFATFDVEVAGVRYARLTTVDGINNTAIGSIVYENGASGNISQMTIGQNTNWLIDLPANVPDAATLTFRHTPRNPVAGSSRDDFYIDTVSVLTCTNSISGTVFEDPNYGGGAGRPLSTATTSPRDGAVVELYKSDGSYLGNTTTASGGKYSFNVTAGDYFVRVVNSTVTSSRGTGSILPVQTFRMDKDASGVPIADPNRVGGEKPSEVDAPANSGSQTLTALNALTNQEAQSIAPVKVGSSNVTGIDFGYNFDTIVNTNNSGQGSLRQFILNSNTLTNSGLAQVGQTSGKEVSIFMIPSGIATPGIKASIPSQLTGGVATISVSGTQLPDILDADTSIDGTTQTANVGNTNSGIDGTGSTVGVDGIPLSQVNKPEVEINDGINTIPIGLRIVANNTTVRGISIWGFGNGTGDGNGINTNIKVSTITRAAACTATNSFTGVLIENNFIGTTAAGFSSAPATGNGGSGFVATCGGSGEIKNNLIGFTKLTALFVSNRANLPMNYEITNNEIRSGGLDNTADNIGLENGAINVKVEGNLITGAYGNGVSIFDTPLGSGNLINNNTISASGAGSNAEWAGIAAFQTAATRPTTNIIDTFSKNIVTNSKGAGFWFETTYYGGKITQNSIYNNGGLGIDLKGTTLDNGTGNQTTIANTVTPNDGSNTVTNIANKGTDYPIITSSKLNASGDLTVSGYVGTGIVTTSPFAGATLEFFVANNTPANQDGEVIAGDGKSKSHGEGQTYIGGSTTGNLCTVATNGSFSCTFPAVGAIVSDPKNITATTTDTLGNTSEFSAPVSSNANVLLVKRITAINGDRIKNPNDNTPLNVFVDDPLTHDNNANWPTPTSGTPPISNFLAGVIDAGKVKPGDTIEYTIYFLNAGGSNANNVRVCDRIIDSQKILSGSPILLQKNSATPTILTSNADTDRATFYASSSDPVITNCNFTGTPTIDNGAIVVDVTGSSPPTWTTLPGSTGAGTTDTYGFVRFTTKVNP